MNESNSDSRLPPAPQANSHSIEYRIGDFKCGNPVRTIHVQASQRQLQHLVTEGYLVLPNILTESSLARLRAAVNCNVRREVQNPSTPPDRCFGARYLRHLLEKDDAFLELFYLETTLSIAQAVLGPQVKFDEVAARVVDLSESPNMAPWHVHHRVIPSPMPPFFCYPHGLNCLLYLDDADGETGPLCVLPGSHHLTDSMIEHPNDHSSKPGEVILAVQAGTCVLIHINLWHRSLQATRTAGLRRLLLFGYLPSWLGGEEVASYQPMPRVSNHLRESRDPRVRERVGAFDWTTAASLDPRDSGTKS